MSCDLNAYTACPSSCTGISKPSIWQLCMSDCQLAACPDGLQYPLCDYNNCAFDNPCLRVSGYDCSEFAGDVGEACEVAGYLELSPSAVDTLVAVFQNGYLGGVLWSIVPFAGIFSILAVIGLITHAVKYS